MDMIYKRYACPLPILEQMIQVDRLAEFVAEFVSISNEEVRDQTLWEFYLHHEMLSESFEEFRNRCVPSKEEKQPAANLEATVNHSKQMLDDFRPDDEQ